MKTDRELLELAARAAGLQIGHLVSFFGGEYAVTQDHSEINAWNPLECDGDAFQLAVSVPRISMQRIIAEAWISHTDLPGRMAYARRAIVRAAAAIGAGLAPFPTADQIREDWT